MPHVHDANPGRIDWTGAVLLGIGLVGFLIGISKANAWGWGDPKTLGCIAGGVVVLVLWGWFELAQAEPLVDLRTTAQLPVLMTNIAAVAIGFGMMAQSIVMPQLLQLPEATGYGLRQSMLHAGLWMAAGGLMMMVFAPISSVLIKRFGPADPDGRRRRARRRLPRRLRPDGRRVEAARSPPASPPRASASGTPRCPPSSWTTCRCARPGRRSA